MAGLARCLFYYFIVKNGKTDKGYSFTEQREDYKNFNAEVYVPKDFHGKMPNGDAIENGATFLSLRSKYKQDPLWPQLENCLKNNTVFEYKYHRFW